MATDVEEVVVQKLASPVSEIAHRAAANIAFKLQSGIVESGTFLERTPILVNLLTALRQNDDPLPFLRLLQTLVYAEPVRVKGQLLALDASRVIQANCLNNTSKEVKDLARDICSQLLTHSQVAGYRFENDSETTVSDLTVVTENVEESTYRGIPDRVLEQTHPNSSGLSPVPRISGYLANSSKKSVTFEESTASCDLDGLFEWQLLFPQDLDTLVNLQSGLEADDKDSHRSALLNIINFTLLDFYPEVFLQRPTVVDAVHSLFCHSPDLKVRLLAAQSLSLLCSKLMDRIKFISEFVCEKQPGEMMFETSSEATETSDVRKYDDVINTRDLKQQQLSLEHYGVRTLSGALEAIREQLETDEWKSSEQVQLLRQSASLVHHCVALCSQVRSSNVCECRNVLAASLELVYNWGYANANIARFRRVAALTVIKASVAFAKAFGGLTAPLSRLILDVTLHYSHGQLHSEICSLFASHPNLLKYELVRDTLIPSLKETAKLIHNKSPQGTMDQLTKALDSLQTYHWHEWQGVVPLTLRACTAYGKHLYTRDKEFLDRVKPIMGQAAGALLRHEDKRLRTSAYLALHDTVQDVLGIGQALDLEGREKHKLAFLVEVPGILTTVAETGLSDSCSEVRTCSEEIWMYFLKSRHVLGPVWWDRFKSNVLLPSLPLLIPHLHNTVYLGRHLTGLLSATAQPLELDKHVLLECNSWLLFHSEEEIRHAAGNNIKCLLSQEPGSHQKLPRFAQVVATDFAGLFYGKMRQVQTRKCSGRDEDAEGLLSVVAGLKDVLDGDSDMAPEDLMLLARTNLTRLEVLIDNWNLRSAMAKRYLPLLRQVWDKVLDEMDVLQFSQSSLLPCLVSILNKILVSHTLPSTDWLYLLLRSAILSTESDQVLTDVAVCLLLLLNASSLTVKSSMADNFSLPVENVTVEHTPAQSLPLDPEVGPLLKTYWNTTLFDAEELQFKTDDVAPNLRLSLSEMNVFLASDERCFDQQLFSDLKGAGGHADFSLSLSLAELSMTARERFHTDRDLLTVFSRFFAKTPTSYRDEKLFLVILQFLETAIRQDRGRDCAQLSRLVEDAALKSSNLVKFMTVTTAYSGKSEIHDLNCRLIAGRFVDTLLSSRQSQATEQFVEALMVGGREIMTTGNRVLSRFLRGLASQDKADFCRRHKSEFGELLSSLDTSRRNALSGSHALKQGLIIANEVLEALKSFSIRNLDLLLTSRDTELRILGLQLISATMEFQINQSSSAFVSPDTAWRPVMRVCLDNFECTHARSLAFFVLEKLVANHVDTAPTYTEPVSRVEIEGEPALAHYLASVDLVPELVSLFAAFTHTAGDSPDSEDQTVKSTLCPPPDESRTVVTSSASLLASVFSFLSEVISLEIQFNKENLRGDDSLNLKEWLHLLPADTLHSRLLPVIYKSMPKYQSFENEPSYGDMVANLADLTALLVARHREAGTGLLPEFPGGLGLKDLLGPEALIVMGQQLMGGKTSQLESVFAAVSQILALRDSSSLRGTTLESKHSKALFQMIRHQLKNNPGRSEHALSLSSILTVNQDDATSLTSVILDIGSELIREFAASHSPLVTEALANVFKIYGQLELSPALDELDQYVISAIARVNQAVSHFCAAEAFNLCRQLDCLTNFCGANMSHKESLVDQGLMTELSSLAQLLFRPNPILAPGSRDQVQLAVSTLDLCTTLTSHCEAAKRALVKGSDCLMNTFISDVICGGRQSYKFVVPTVYRLVISSVTSMQVRSYLVKKNTTLLTQAVEGVVSEAEQQKKCALMTTMHLDILLSLSAFTDGHVWAAGKADPSLVTALTAVARNKAAGFLAVHRTAALAILHNLSFSPTSRSRLLLSSSVLEGLAKNWIGDDDVRVRNMALRIAWNLAANNFKGKVALAQAGVSKAVSVSAVRHPKDPLLASVNTLLAL